MIRINLLPEELKGRGRRVAAARGEGLSALVVLVIVLFLALDAGAFYLVYQRQAAAKAETKRLQDDLAAKQEQLNKQMPEYQRLVDIREQLKVKEAILKTLDPADRLLWSQKLNMLCYIVHPQVYLTQLQLTEKTEMKETAASIKRRQDWDKSAKTGSKPESVTVPIITQTLTISGITTGKDSHERLDSFRQFLNTLQNYKTKNNRGVMVGFMDGFSSKAEIAASGLSLEEKVGSKEVGKFSITLSTVPISGEVGS